MSIASENGWQPAKASPDQCEWVIVPGTGVSLQLLKGQPLTIMRAFAADFNAYVEPLRDADSAGWTPTNSVATSNHLNGTAMDLNWDSHPFRVLNAGFTADKIRAVRDLLAFYENTIWWGNDWNTPKDAMHFQMGYDTYGNPHTQDFITRKIRADGFSTFRRGSVPQQISKADNYALAIIHEGQRRNITPRGIQIALATALVESGLKMWANAKVPESMNLPHDAVGFDGLSVGLFQQQVKDTGNGWWWSDAATCMDPAKSAGLFYDRLVRLDYNGPNSPGSYAQAVQRSAYPDRYDQRFTDAVNLYNRLAGPAPLPEEDFLSALTPDEQRNLYNAVMAQRQSRSPLRHVGEGTVGDMPDQIWDTDGSVHVLVVYLCAVILGDPDAIALLHEVANVNTAQYPDRRYDARLAKAMLNVITGQATTQSAPPTGQTPGVIPTPVIPAPVPQPIPAPAPIAPLPAPQPALPAVNGSTPDTGEVIAKLYRALDDLRLADAMPIEARAPMSALVQILQTKNGTSV